VSALPSVVVSDGVPPAHQANIAAFERAVARGHFDAAPDDAVFVVDGIADNGAESPDPKSGAMAPAQFAQYVAFLTPEGLRNHLTQKANEKPAPGHRWLVSLLPDGYFVATVRSESMAPGGEA
jgi:hypothetical protein